MTLRPKLAAALFVALKMRSKAVVELMLRHNVKLDSLTDASAPNIPKFPVEDERFTPEMGSLHLLSLDFHHHCPMSIPAVINGGPKLTYR